MNHFLDILGDLMLCAIAVFVFAVPVIWYCWIRSQEGYKDDR